MAAREADVIIANLVGTFNATNTPSAGTTAVAVVNATGGGFKVHLNQVGWAVKNLTAAAYAATLTIRDTNTAGTILAQWPMLVPAGASLQDSWAVNFNGLTGNPLSVDFGLPNSSVVQSVNIAGWQEPPT